MIEAPTASSERLIFICRMSHGLFENAQAERLMPALRDTSLDLIGIGVEACSQSASLHDRLTTARRRAICLETRVTKLPTAHMPHQRDSRAIPSSGGTPCFGSQIGRAHVLTTVTKSHLV